MQEAGSARAAGALRDVQQQGHRCAGCEAQTPVPHRGVRPDYSPGKRSKFLRHIGSYSPDGDRAEVVRQAGYGLFWFISRAFSLARVDNFRIFYAEATGAVRGLFGKFQQKSPQRISPLGLRMIFAMMIICR